MDCGQPSLRLQWDSCCRKIHLHRGPRKEIMTIYNLSVCPFALLLRMWLPNELGMAFIVTTMTTNRGCLCLRETADMNVKMGEGMRLQSPMQDIMIIASQTEQLTLCSPQLCTDAVEWWISSHWNAYRQTLHICWDRLWSNDNCHPSGEGFAFNNFLYHLPRRTAFAGAAPAHPGCKRKSGAGGLPGWGAAAELTWPPAHLSSPSRTCWGWVYPQTPPGPAKSDHNCPATLAKVW